MKSIVFFLAMGFAISAQAQTASHHGRECGHMSVWDYDMGMCAPFPMRGMPMKMLMLDGQAFFTGTSEERPRGRDAFSIPNHFMADIGSSVGDRQYFNLDFMGTVERWTYPRRGTPELLQIGEDQSNGEPFLDAQHPHSSPVMGITLSDTIALGHNKDHVKFWFAPRGASTDGPVAFMHRPTGIVNPDAPLGHHIGQDVGHISSTVIGGAVHLAQSTLELSTFHGAEPEPTHVDMPMGSTNSYAARFIQDFNQHLFAMASAAYVKSPEPHDPDLDHIWRYSLSVYGENALAGKWHVHEALIWGLINGYDGASALNSFNEEFVFGNGPHNIWGRLEILQRTANELSISDPNGGNLARWVTALTVGYTRRLESWNSLHLAVGGSVTKDFLPIAFRNAYAGDPISGKVFLQLSGMKMWML